MEYQDEITRMRERSSRVDPRRRKPAGTNDRISQALIEEDIERKAMVKQRKRKKRRRRLVFIEFLILLAVLAGAYFLFQKKPKDDGFWTIAIFGVDSRSGQLGKGALSDVEMICNINKATGEIKLVSVYRDTYLKIDSKGTFDKINEAYFKGGPQQAVAALKENLGVDIDDYAAFNWKAVADAINILGGVDLEITDKEFKYINSFITETVESTGVGSHQLKKPGMNHLDGVQAVAYARLRLMDTDFNRTERQRKVVSLAMEKAKKAKFSVLNNILVTVLPQIKTSIGIGDLIPLAKGIHSYHLGETGGFPFSRVTKRIHRKDLVIPTTLESNVVELHRFLYGDEGYVVPGSIKRISEKIVADTDTASKEREPKKEAAAKKREESQAASTKAQEEGNLAKAQEEENLAKAQREESLAKEKENQELSRQEALGETPKETGPGGDVAKPSENGSLKESPPEILPKEMPGTKASINGWKEQDTSGPGSQIEKNKEPEKTYLESDPSRTHVLEPKEERGPLGTSPEPEENSGPGMGR